MNRPMPRRLLVAAALGSALVGVLLVLGLRLARPALQSAASQQHLGGIDHEACNATPTTWGWASGDVSYFAYDRTGQSANPSAPPLEEDLLRRALADDRVAIENSAARHIFVVPYASAGPCALVRVTSRSIEAVVTPWFGGILAGAIVIGMLLSVFGTLWLVVRPLRSRIEELATAAEDVGGASFAPQPARSDALGHIAEVLERSHGRLIESREALEQRNRALERHLAGVAHDLRTPLSSMHLALESLATESKGPVQKEARRALADAVYLSSMVENLHHATRLRHEIDVASGSVELTDLVRRLEKRFAIVGRHAGVEVAANTPEREVWVACTPALAERAVANLVQNAVEHNDGPGHVAITLSLEEPGGRFQLVVADDGPGLPRDALASLQSESFLVDEARPRGPGMGMLITREVARRAGWSVRYVALEPKGLEVRLEGAVVDPG